MNSINELQVQFYSQAILDCDQKFQNHHVVYMNDLITYGRVWIQAYIDNLASLLSTLRKSH